MSKPLYEILDRPVISEKSVKESALGRYTFKCKTGANKTEIKEAVESVFDVKVKAVNTMTVKGKTKRMGRGRPGKAADYKKAIVTLEKDSTSQRLREIFEGA